ncbi:MAG: flippase-like domain-containing protein [Gemmatimonadales bacterium]|nr:flippase-like domain-containing protein [Gemmatimonadales bacterium]
MKGLLIVLGKIAVSAALIGFLLSRLSLEEIRLAMGSPRWGWLFAAFVVYGLSAFGGALQWAWILRVAGLRTPGREIRRLYFIGLFFNNFLPANVGGDAWKIVDLGRQEHRSLGVFCATLLDRLIGLGALAGLAVLVLAVASAASIPLPTISLLMIPVLVLLAGGLAFLLSRRIGNRLPGLFERLGLGRFADQLGRVVAEFGHFRPRVLWLNGIFAFSLVIQLLRMATHLLVALGLGIELGSDQMIQLMVLIPLLAVSLTLPITINGIGLREQLSAKLLIWAGLAGPQAVAMELGAFLVQVIFSLQGGILLWMGRWGKAADKQHSEGN